MPAEIPSKSRFIGKENVVKQDMFLKKHWKWEVLFEILYNKNTLSFLFSFHYLNVLYFCLFVCLLCFCGHLHLQSQLS